MFYIMIDDEQSADSANTLEEARLAGQILCDAEMLPSSFSIYEDDEFVEDIRRTDGRNLSQQIADFDVAHSTREIQ